MGLLSVFGFKSKATKVKEMLAEGAIIGEYLSLTFAHRRNTMKDILPTR
jgi:hypothetical protein